MKRLLCVLSLLCALGVTQQGCGHRAAHRVNKGEDLRIDNDGAKTVDLYVGGGFVGEIDPGEELLFEVLHGYRDIDLREHGDPVSEHKADYLFNGDSVLEIVHEPVAGDNLVFINDDASTVHVYVDGSEIGSVSSGATESWDVSVGTRSIAIRESGDVFVTDYGDLVFSSSTQFRITYDD